MLNWIWILLVLMLFGVFGSSQTRECATADGCHPPFGENWHPVTINGNEGVVLPADAGWQLVGGDVEADGHWVPDAADLQRAEDAVARESTETPGLDERGTGGYRQYAGFIEDGQRKIYINSFYTEFEDWRSSPIFVLDGGACFWQAVYNADTGEVERISVNGDA